MANPRVKGIGARSMAAKGKNSRNPNASRKGTIQLQTGQHTDDAKNEKDGNYHGPPWTRHILYLMEN